MVAAAGADAEPTDTVLGGEVAGSHLTKHGLLFCVDAQRDGKRFIVPSDELLSAFLELEANFWECNFPN